LVETQGSFFARIVGSRGTFSAGEHTRKGDAMATSEEKRQREEREKRLEPLWGYLRHGGAISQNDEARIGASPVVDLGRVGERRDLSEGAQNLGNVSGAGAFVPMEMYEDILLGMSNFDNLFGQDDVGIVRDETTEGFITARPFQIAGWDLSSISAGRVAEGSPTQDVAPLAIGDVLNPFMYTEAIPLSFQLDQDATETLHAKMIEAFAIALGRGMGKDLVNGTGTNQPQGVLTGAANSGYSTGSATSLTLDDFTGIFFSVDRTYRASPKCRWVMNDATYKLVRQATDSNGRPLIDIDDDAETILGKRVLISPSMPTGSGSKGIVFGDLSHFVVRLSKMAIQRTEERADYAQWVYRGRMRVDSAVFDPTSGAVPPIVYATLA
jgi:HK97 family phage major capsid protein